MNQLFVKDLTVIDFSYFEQHRGIVGESWIVDIVLSGELDEQGMVFDFGHVKKVIKQLIDEEVDHRFVIAGQEPSLVQSGDQEQLQLTWQGELGEYKHNSPAAAVLILDCTDINKHSVADYLVQKVHEVLPKNVSQVEIKLREEALDQAFYHYSHGLKKHDGNCQRIVHGHRSTIEIYRNAQRDQGLEDFWAATFRNIYIATREDLQHQDNNAMQFGYIANQGEFSLSIPKSSVYILETDSTVELIAAHIADQCRIKHPDDHIEVHAFEGVGKGAIATRSN